MFNNQNTNIMKKIFLLIPVLALSLMVNATKTTIDNTSTDALRKALYYSSVGDTIVMTAGTYEESNSDYIAWKRDNVVMAAEGATVIIKPHVSFRVRGGARGELIGVKIDASGLGSYKNIFESGENIDGNRLILKNCEIYGNPNESVVRCASDKKLDSLIINNCYIHNNAQVILRLESASLKGLTITNSTFANVANGGSFWVAPMEIKSAAAGAKVIVDHCTFYNVQSISTSYGLVNVGSGITDATVSNCIFVLPATADMCATNLQGGGDVKNTLTYNYDNWQECGHFETATLTNCFKADPLFTDAVNADYSFPGNWVTMSLSPARGAATDGTDLGDPRWYTEETLPNTSFASAYDFLGTKAVLSGRIELNANDKIHFKHNSLIADGTAKWKLHVGKACTVNALVDVETGCDSGRQLTLTVKDADGNTIATLAQGSATYDDTDIELGQIVFPEEGDYIFILTNSLFDSGVILEKITLSYIGGAVQNMPGTTDINEAWFSADGTRAGGVIDFPDGKIQDNWVKWNVAFASAANFNVIVNLNSNNCKNYTVSLLDANGDDVVTPLSKNDCSTKGTPISLEMGAMTGPAGNYVLQVVNGTKDSDAELISVQFVPAGGGLVSIPGDISFSEVILSSRAFIDGNGEIRFTDDDHAGHILEESAKWRIHPKKDGYYKFTTSVNSVNGHSYLVSIYNADESELIGSIAQSGDDIWGAPKTFSTDNIFLEDEDYVLKVQNTTKDSKGRIESISASYEGGTTINLSNAAIPFADAILSSRAFVESGELHFTDADHLSSISDEWAKWNVHATASLYNFTINVVGSNYGIYELTILDSGNNEVYKTSKGKEGSGEISFQNVPISTEGKYIVQLANTNDYSNGYVTSFACEQLSIITIDEVAENNDVIKDNYRTGDLNILLAREFAVDMYNTICLPFDVSSSKLKTVFGNDVELLQMSSAVLDGDILNLNFEVVTSSGISRGTPYLIKTSNGVKNPIFAGVEIKVKEADATGGEGFDADFIGTFIKTTIDADPDNLYLQANNILNFSNNAVTIKGSRAYFHVKIPGASSIISRARIVKNEEEVSAVELVNSENNSRKVIEDGQLIIIRDGVRYNVMGIVIEK